MKEEIYRWVKTIAFFYIVFSAVLHLVPDVKYERYIRSFMGILLIYILSTPVFNLFGNGEKLLQEFRLNYQEELTALEEKNTENLQALYLQENYSRELQKEISKKCKENGIETDLEDGEYSIQVDLEGGSGKASVSSPTLMLVKNGRMYAELQWSSSNYDYMIVDGEKFQNESEEGRNSVFTIPVTALDDKMEVIADTLAMGAPHEIDYTLTFYEASIGSKGQLPQEAAKRVVVVAMVIIVGGGILNYFVNKRNRC